MTINSTFVKETAKELGLDLCGIAPVGRFEGAPEGFHPCDVLPECRSVIVLAKRFLNSTLKAKTTIPYTDIRNSLSRGMDDLAIRFSYILEDRGAVAVPVNSIGPCDFDLKTMRIRGIVSLKHAAVMAGLGKIGKNTLLINERYGNMIWLSAVLVSEMLEPDPMADYQVCPPDCNDCVDVCPVKALGNESMKQKECWEYAFGKHNGGEWRIKCNECRKICPNCLGITK